MNFPLTPASLFGVGPITPAPDWRLPAWLVAATFATLCLGWLHVTARRSRYGLRYLYPLQFETLVALAQTAIREPRVTPVEVATAIDRHWADVPGRERRRVRVSLLLLYVLPLFRAHVPFPLMDDEARRKYLERHFIIDAATLLSPIRAALRFTLQMVYMGYYSQPETHQDTGYEPFSEREQAPPKVASTLKVLDRPAPGELEAEIVIVGTGAAGGVLAHTLVEQGHDVLMLERGDFVDPATFTENELEMYGRLYSDGAIQLSRDFTFQILQGRCVGGGTVVNNAVCFDLPPEILARWNAAGAGLPDTLDPSFAAVRALMRVERQDDAPRSRGVDRVVDAIEALKLDLDPYRSGVVDANIHKCAGCGYCNLGCAYGRKLSMIDLVLPRAQRAADHRRGHDPSYTGRLRILPACEVLRVERAARRSAGGGGAQRVGGVVCRVGTDGDEQRIKAGTVVVAAGAIHSSRLLQRSKIGGSQVGNGLCANLATFMTGDFGEPVRSFDGLQIAHYVAPPQQCGYVMETWFNPVVITALSMPGWLHDHQHNMNRYAHMMCVGVLVGTDPQPANRVHRPTLLTGSEFNLRPSDTEVGRLAQALKQAGEILFHAGADRVLPPTFGYRQFSAPEQLDELQDLLRRKENRSLQTAHPQGGNALSSLAADGVVDPTCRVHGYENLYVCDASVFPTAITVNPQLTVMAVAHHAATHPDGLGALAS